MFGPDNASTVLSFGWQNRNAITGCDSAVAAKVDALERVGVAEETAAVSLNRWTFEKIYIVRQLDEAPETVERLNIY